MRFSLAESMCDPAHYAPLARAAEEAGWDSFVVPDSLFYPARSETAYPYTPDGDRGFLQGKPFIEPFSLIPALAAVTERLRFTTFVLKLPVRHPVLVAKSASSVACLAPGRFALGVGSSPWPEDYAVCGQAWARRGRRMDEMIEIIRGLLEGGFYEKRGEFYEIPPIQIRPVPDEPLPILIGGHSGAALARAARLGDGWMHAGGDEEALDVLLARLGALRRDAGRESLPFEVHVISARAYSRDGLARLEDRGVTDVIVGFRDVYREPDWPLAQKIDALRRYADEIIART